MNTHILTVQKIDPEKRDQKPSKIDDTFFDIHGGGDDGTVGVGEVATWSVELTPEEEEEFANHSTRPSNLIAMEENVQDSAFVLDPETLNGIPEAVMLEQHHTRSKLDFLQENPSKVVKHPVVSILDTGVDQAFPLKSSVIGGQSWISGEPWDQTTHFHGMHVAGLAHRHNIGMKFLIAKVLSNGGFGYRDGIVAAMYWSVDNGADIINMSLGGPGEFSTAYQDAVNYALARGVQTWAAMGNDGMHKKSLPAAIPGVRAVIALDAYNQRADFSTYGEWAFCSARGTELLSYSTGGRYIRASGTSMATPYCAGEDALLVARFGRDSQRVEAFSPTGHILLGIPRNEQGQIGRICVHRATNWMIKNG